MSSLPAKEGFIFQLDVFERGFEPLESEANEGSLLTERADACIEQVKSVQAQRIPPRVPRGNYR